MPHVQPYRDQWIQAIERFQEFDHQILSYHVCSLYFSSNDIVRHSKKKSVRRGRVPSIFPNIHEIETIKSQKKIENETKSLTHQDVVSNIAGNNSTHQLLPSQADILPSSNDYPNEIIDEIEYDFDLFESFGNTDINSTNSSER